MRNNYARVKKLQTEFIDEIKNWFTNKPGTQAIKFKNMFSVRIDVAAITGDYDWGTELFVVDQLTYDGFVVDSEGGETFIDELSCDELAFILDEIADDKFEIINE